MEPESNNSFIVDREPKRGGRPKKLNLKASWREYQPVQIKCFIEKIRNSPLIWSIHNIDNVRESGEFPMKHYNSRRVLAFDMVEMECAWFMRRNRGAHARRLWGELLFNFRQERNQIGEVQDKSTNPSFPYYSEMEFLNTERAIMEVENSKKVPEEITETPATDISDAKNESDVEMGNPTKNANPMDSVVIKTEIPDSISFVQSKRKMPISAERGNIVRKRRRVIDFTTTPYPIDYMPAPLSLESSIESTTTPDHKELFDVISMLLSRCSTENLLVLKNEIINFVDQKVSEIQKTEHAEV